MMKFPLMQYVGSVSTCNLWIIVEDGNISFQFSFDVPDFFRDILLTHAVSNHEFRVLRMKDGEEFMRQIESDPVFQMMALVFDIDISPLA